MKYNKLNWTFNTSSHLTPAFVAFLNDNVNLEIQANSGIKHQVIYREFKGKKYVIKRYTNLDKKGLDRKIELSLKSFFRPAAKKSFMGAKSLEESGIPTIKPIAWSKRGFFHRRISIFVYEYIDAISDAYSFIESSNYNEMQKEKIIRNIAKITRDMHDKGFKHHDIILNNFLVVKFDKDFKIFLIDTDSISSSHLSRFSKTLKIFFDLRCVRRFRPKDKYLKIFFEEYFHDNVKNLYLYFWLFWVRGGFNLHRRNKLKKTLEKRFINFSIDKLKNS